MDIQGVVFDLDGTLLNTLDDLAGSMNKVLAQHGFPVHSVDAYRYYVGDGVKNLVKRALPGFVPEKDRRRCIEEFKQEYGKHWADHTRPYAGVVQMLQALNECNVKTAVFTNKPQDVAEETVHRFLPESLHPVIGASEQRPLKPDPEGALLIAKMLGLSPNRFAYVGDSGVDMQTALEAEMYPVGALWGFRDKEELEIGGARSLITHPGELFPLIGIDGDGF